MIWVHYDEKDGRMISAFDQTAAELCPEPRIAVSKADFTAVTTEKKCIIDGKLQPFYGVEDFDAVMENYIRQVCAVRGYTTREPSAYLNSAVPRWHQDALDFIAFRDKVMEYALQVMDDASAGKTPDMDSFIAGLPEIKWSSN